MKVTNHSALLALLMTSGLVHAQVTITNPPLPAPQVLGVEGNVEIRLPDPPATSTGTAPTPSSPIGNAQNAGFTNSGVPSTIFAYSTNGSGLQTQTVQTNGGVLATPAGNVTLNETVTATATATYSIEARAIKVSDPLGFTDAAGTYGPVGTFYANGVDLPGTTTFVATVRDANGNLVSVISDLAGVGPVTATDLSGFPVLTPAQVAAAVAAGAPAQFFNAGTPTVTPGTGDLTVQGNTILGNSPTDTTTVNGALTTTGNVGSATSSTTGNATVGGTLGVTGATTTNGINNSGQKITGLANGTNAADAATFGQMQIADNALGLRIDSEISARIAADATLTTDLANEVTARTNADNAIRGEFAAADTTERNARIAGDSRLQSNIDENTRGIAMVAAMTNTTVDIGKTHGVDFNMAQFQSETGFAFGYANRINENVQVHTSVASTTDFDESVVRLGVAVQW